MINKKIKTLEEMGIVVIENTPNFSHKNTQEEYDNRVQMIHTLLERCRTILTDRLNLIQKQILNIAVDKLYEIFKFYYNTNICRPNFKVYRSFKHNIKELDNFATRYLESGSNEEKEFRKMTQQMKKMFVSHVKSIRKIEGRIIKEKIKPFTKTVQYTDRIGHFSEKLEV